MALRLHQGGTAESFGKAGSAPHGQAGQEPETENAPQKNRVYQKSCLKCICRAELCRVS
jgi:hypothetical protein